MNKYNSDLLTIDRSVCPAETTAPKKTILGRHSSKTKEYVLHDKVRNTVRNNYIHRQNTMYWQAQIAGTMQCGMEGDCKWRCVSEKSSMHGWSGYVSPPPAELHW